VSLYVFLRKFDAPLKIGIACKATARQPVKNLVCRIQQNTAWRPNHFSECLPSKLTLTKRAVCPNLVGCNLPLKLHVSVWTLGKPDANYPTPVEPSKREPINTGANQSDTDGNQRAAMVDEAAAAQNHEAENEVKRKPKYWAAGMTEVIVLRPKQLIRCPTKMNDDWLFHAG
jgi:hypothetical protein